MAAKKKLKKRMRKLKKWSKAEILNFKRNLKSLLAEMDGKA